MEVSNSPSSLGVGAVILRGIDGWGMKVNLGVVGCIGCVCGG